MDRENDTGLVRAAKWVEAVAVEYGPTLIVAFAGLGWTLFKTFITDPPAHETWLHFFERLALGVALASLVPVGAVLTYKRNGAIRTLKKDKGDLQLEVQKLKDAVTNLSSSAKDIWRSRLSQIAKDLNLDNTFRLNIYRYAPDTKTFVMIGRYADIMKYNNPGRVFYPSEIGCIGEAWESPISEAIADDLPEDENEYIKQSCERWNFEPDTVKELSMKSRSIYAFTIKDAHDLDRMAVIVFESTEPKAADADKLREAVAYKFRKQLLLDLATLKFIEPSQALAQNAGF